MKYSRLWNAMYLSKDHCGSGNTWWKDLEKCDEYHSNYGTLILQEHKNDNGFINGVRAIAPWSNHTHKYRIIYHDKYPKSKWKELDHSDDKSDMNTKYDEYKKTIEWKRAKFG